MSKILKAITTRYMIVFMSLIIITIFVLGVLIASIITSYSVDEKMDELSSSNMIFETYYKIPSEMDAEQSSI